MSDDVKKDEDLTQAPETTAEAPVDQADTQTEISAENANAPEAPAPHPSDDLSEEEFEKKLKQQQEQFAQEERDKIDRAIEERNRKSIEQALTAKEREAEENKLKKQKQLAHEINGFHKFFNMPGAFNPDVLGKVADVAVKGKNMHLILADQSGHVINTGKKIKFHGEQMTTTAASVIASEIIAQGWDNIKLKGSSQQKTMMAAALIEQDPRAVTEAGLSYKDLKEAVQNGDMSVEEYAQNMVEIIRNYDKHITPTMGASVTGFKLSNPNVTDTILQMLDFEKPDQSPSAEMAIREISDAEHEQDMNQLEQAMNAQLEALNSEIDELKTNVEELENGAGNNITPEMQELKGDIEAKIDFYNKQRKTASEALEKMHDISASQAVKDNKDEYRTHMSAFKMAYFNDNTLDVVGLNQGLDTLATTIGYKSSHPNPEQRKAHNDRIKPITIPAVSDQATPQQPKKDTKAAPA